MMLICMLISIHEKVKQHRMSEKTVAYIKKSCISNSKFAGSCKKRWNPKKGEMKIFFWMGVVNHAQSCAKFLEEHQMSKRTCAYQG